MSDINNVYHEPDILMEVEHLPYLAEEELKGSKYQTYPLNDLAALGVSVQPLALAISDVLSQGGTKSGIYFVNSKGKTLVRRKDSNVTTGIISQESGAVGGGFADLYRIPCDPTMLFMSFALMNIEKKLDNIEELQQEMLDFFKAEEKAKIRGNVYTLIDILNNYKFNWDNEKYKTNKHILVQDIRRDAEQSIQLCRDQIQRIMSKKGVIASDQETKAKLRNIENEFKDYQLALYQYAFASFLEILLLENFASDYLENMTARIEELSLQYRELYTDCYNQLERILDNSVQSAVAGGVAGLSKGAGELIGKIPIVNKGPVDETLVETGQKIEEKNSGKADRALSELAELSVNCTAPFVQGISEINQLYNEPKVIYFDRENLYLVNAN